MLKRDGAGQSIDAALLDVRVRFLSLFTGDSRGTGLCNRLADSGRCSGRGDFCSFIRGARSMAPRQLASLLTGGEGPESTPLEGPCLGVSPGDAISAWNARESSGEDTRGRLEDMAETHGDRVRRRLAGSYYTLPTAVEFMSRAALCLAVRDRFPDLPGLAEELAGWAGGEPLSPGRASQIRGAIEGIRIKDPASGSGAFLLGVLREMIRMTGGALDVGGTISRCLYGVDADPVAVAVSRYLLWQAASESGCMPGFRANVSLGDSLAGTGDDAAYDIVLANPPYVRHECVDPGVKARLRIDYPGFSGRSDLYVYFFPLIERLLKEGGVAAVICPTTWMSVGYGRRLCDYIAERFEVLAVIRSAVERWFPDASVDAGIVLLRKRGASRPRLARMFTLDRPLADVEWNELMSLTDAGDTDPPLDAGFCCSAVSDRALAGRRWAGFFERKGLERLLPGFDLRACKLGDIAAVRRGFTTGANGFFYVRILGESARGGCIRVSPSGSGREGPIFDIPAGMLNPLIRSPREIASYRVERDALRYSVVLIPRSVEMPEGVARLIEWGRACGYHERPTCAARSPWWVLKAGGIPPVVWAMTVRERFFAALNDVAYADARLYGIYQQDGIDPVLLAALLNSSMTWLQAEYSCRTYGGGGGPLDTKVYEVEDLLIPDPRLMDAGTKEQIVAAFRTLLGRRVLPVHLEAGMDDRAALDKTVLLSAGVDQWAASRAAAEIRGILVGRVRERTSRARNTMGMPSAQKPSGRRRNGTSIEQHNSLHLAGSMGGD